MRGFEYTFRHEQNFRVQVFVAIAVILLMIMLPVKLWEAIILIMIIVSVLILEILNTIFEKITDLLKPRLSHYVQIIKDMMAMAVLLASVGAIVIGLIIFLPHIF